MITPLNDFDNDIIFELLIEMLQLLYNLIDYLLNVQEI